MIRIWRRNETGFGRKWIEVDTATDLDDAMRRLSRTGPGKGRLTDEKGAEIITVTIRHRASNFSRPRLRLFVPSRN